VIRLRLPLGDKTDWLKVFDPRGGGVFVPAEKPPDIGAEVCVDLTIGPANEGPRVILRGNVAWRRADGDPKRPNGCGVGLDVSEREKVNFLNGYVRGGLLNRRERRRLPLRLPVHYGMDETRALMSLTRDINEEGVFIVADAPLPEHTLIYFQLVLPTHPAPLDLTGVVTHTVIVEDEDVPGMGIVFQMDDDKANEVTKIIDELEAGFMAGTLPEDVIS
jgi:Tfp pilus assembly protein PilZ